MKHTGAVDKNGIPIMPGDTLKVFHFTGARRKKHYMYKFVESVDGERLTINHLRFGLDTRYSTRNEGVYEDYEIVQGFGYAGRCFTDREKVTK